MDLPACRRALFGLAQGVSGDAATQEVRNEMAATFPSTRTSIIERVRPASVGLWRGVRLATSGRTGSLVKTHCCFCGQQCGIQLKVKDNEVIGFEPWEDFPFNQGMLCPKGVKRYLQGSHPDRLLNASPRPGAQAGFSPMPYEDAIAARRRGDRAHPATHGTTPFGVLSGASLTTEKSYLHGQVRPRLPQDAAHRLQRPALHGQRRGREQEGLRHRPRRQPLVGHSRGRVVWISGAERRRMLADHHRTTSGRRASRAPRSSCVDPRITPIARTCDLFLPVKPGRDVALFNGILHLMIENDWLDHAFIDAAHRRLRGRRGARQRMDAAAHRGSHRHRRKLDPAGGRVVGHRRSQFPVARARHRAPLATACRTCSARSTWCWPRVASAAQDCGYGTIIGQGNGQGGREHGQKCDQLPGWRDISNPEHRALHCRRLGHGREGSARARASTPTRCSARSTRGEIRGLLSHLLQSDGLAARQQLRHAHAGEARVLSSRSISS